MTKPKRLAYEPLEAIPEMPLECLPTALREFAYALANRHDASPDLPASMGLAAIAGVVGGEFEIQVSPCQGSTDGTCTECSDRREDDAWVEQITLWVLSMAPSGAGKTHMLKSILKPIESYEEELRRDRPGEFQRVKLDQRYKALVGGRRKKSKDADDSTEAEDSSGNSEQKPEDGQAEAEEIQKKLKGPTDVLAPDNTTMEALADYLAENEGRGFISADEADLLKIVTGHYSDGKTINGTLLKAFDGQTAIKINRKGSGPVVVDRPLLSISVSVQPGVLLPLFAEHPELRMDGLMGRFLYVTPDSMRAWKEQTRRPTRLPKSLTESWNRLLSRLLGLRQDKARHRRGNPRRLRLTKAACVAFWAAYYDIKSRSMRADGKLFPIQEWASKASGAQLLRLISILCLARLASREDAEWEKLITSEGDEWAWLVEESDVKGAVRLINEYFAPHALRTMGVLSDSDVDVVREKVLRLLKKRHEEEKATFFDSSIAPRDIQRSLYGMTADRLGPVLSRLVAEEVLAKDDRRPGLERYRPNRESEAFK